jgi:hypothetical protein
MKTALVTPDELAELQDGDDLTTNENQAFRWMRELFETPMLKYEDSWDYIGMCSSLDLSPEFRRFSKEHNIDTFVMAKLLVVGMIFTELGGPDGG